MDNRSSPDAGANAGTALPANQTPNAYSLRHPSHRPALLMLILGAVLGIPSGVVTTLLVQAMQPQQQLVATSVARAIAGDTLPSLAAANQRNLLSFDESLPLAAVPEGRSFSYSINYPGASACQMNSPVVSGVAFGATIRVTPSDSLFYPRLGRPVIYRVACLLDGAIVGDSVVLVLEQRRALGAA